MKKVSQNSQENTCASIFIKKETLAQVFSYEFYEISKNTFLHRTPLVAASGLFIKTVFSAYDFDTRSKTKL